MTSKSQNAPTRNTNRDTKSVYRFIVVSRIQRSFGITGTPKAFSILNKISSIESKNARTLEVRTKADGPLSKLSRIAKQQRAITKIPLKILSTTGRNAIIEVICIPYRSSLGEDENVAKRLQVAKLLQKDLTNPQEAQSAAAGLPITLLKALKVRKSPSSRFQIGRDRCRSACPTR